MLNLEFFSDELSEKKVYLVDMSILSILLSPGPGYHSGATGKFLGGPGYIVATFFLILSIFRPAQQEIKKNH
jgi:hypothetical protein